MFTRFTPFRSLFAMVALTGALSAQTLTVPPGVLKAGDNIPVTYSNPAKAGQTVTVKVDDGGFPVAKVTTFQITLNGNGVGTAIFTVPYWELAKFNAPDAPEETRPIV